MLPVAANCSTYTTSTHVPISLSCQVSWADATSSCIATGPSHQRALSNTAMSLVADVCPMPYRPALVPTQAAKQHWPMPHRSEVPPACATKQYWRAMPLCPAPPLPWWPGHERPSSTSPCHLAPRWQRLGWRHHLIEQWSPSRVQGVSTNVFLPPVAGSSTNGALTRLPIDLNCSHIPYLHHATRGGQLLWIVRVCVD